MAYRIYKKSILPNVPAFLKIKNGGLIWALRSFLVFCSLGLVSCASQPAPTSTSKNSGKTEQSKPVGALNSNLESASGATTHRAQAPDLSTNIDDSTQNRASLSIDLPVASLKPSSGHKTQVIGLYPLISVSTVVGSGDLLSVDRSGVVLLWDFRRKSSSAYEVLRLPSGFTALTVNLKKLYLAVAYPDHVEIYSLRSGKSEYQLSRYKTRISSLDFDPLGESILMGGADGIIYRWRFEFERIASAPSELEKSFQRYMGHSSVVNHVRFHPYGRVFFSADWFGSLSAWLTYESDAYQGKYDKNALAGQAFTIESDRVRATRADADIVENFELTSDGELLYLASEKGKVQVWQVRGFKQITEMQAHKGVVYSMAVSPDGNTVVTVGRDGFLRVWQLVKIPTEVRGINSYTLEKRDEQADTNVRTLHFLDSQRLVAGDQTGKLFEINLPSSKESA